MKTMVPMALDAMCLGMTAAIWRCQGDGGLLVKSVNLETAVGCARVCRDWRARQGETTKWATAHKAEQRSMVRQARCNRVHSAVAHQVNVIEAGKVNAHAAFLKFPSGQLPFLG